MGNIFKKRRNAPTKDIPSTTEHKRTTTADASPQDKQTDGGGTQETPMRRSETSDEGSLPSEKVETIGGDPIGYRRFHLTLESLLTRLDAEKLAILFGYPRGNIAKISTSDNPSRLLVQFMDEGGQISPTDISKLLHALNDETIGLGGIAVKVNEAFQKFLPIVCAVEPIVHHNPGPEEKKNQFLTELKNKYMNIFGGIQPVPFLREKHDIDELFVESCIELLEEKQKGGYEQEKWTKITTNYKKIFTDTRLASKRRIIHGDPGYGKSTLALQITQDWCREASSMTKFDVLILLRLREFRNAPTIYSAIKKFLLPRDTILTEDDIKSILNISSTVILLDGYDEYPDRGNKHTDIEHIIREDMFQQHEVVLMTRTSCLPTDFSRDTKRIRLTGFDDAARDRYIRNVVARGNYDDAEEIHRFFRENPVLADFSKIPLFFAMISQMVQKNKKFQNLNTVTDFFRHIVRCFHSHEEIRAGHQERKKELDHTKLDRIAFEGLSGNSQQLSWKKKDLKCKIGHNLYCEYVSIGFLIEEDCFDYNALEYKTETRFCHKLFTEWFASQYLEKKIAKPNVNFEPWNITQSQQTNKPKQNFLKSLNPHDVHYMYRYACGLNSEAAVKIIEHFGKREDYDQYTLLCISEWGGDLEKVSSTVLRLCSRNIKIKDTDSLLLRTSSVGLIKFASSQKLPLCCVELLNSLDLGSHFTSNLPLKPSDLSLPVMTTLMKLVIMEDGLEITEEGTHRILDYTSKCNALQELEFHWCIFPRHIEVTESLSVLCLRAVEVRWNAPIADYILNLESGEWEFWCTPMTDEDYQKEVNQIHRTVELKKKLLGNLEI